MTEDGKNPSDRARSERDTASPRPEAIGTDRLQDHMTARLDAYETQLKSIPVMLDQLAKETRSLLGDVETRQHAAMSRLDEISSAFKDVEKRQHTATSRLDEISGALRDSGVRQDAAVSLLVVIRGQLQDVESRELGIQRVLNLLPDQIQDIVSAEINRLDGYNRYILEKTFSDIVGQIVDALKD